MNHLDKRLAEIERMLAEIERVEADYWRDPSEMTDLECVEEWHRLCHLEPPGQPWPKLDPDEEAAIEAEIRNLLKCPR